MRQSKKKSLSSKKTSFKKRKGHSLVTIEQRKSFIDSVIRGDLKMTLQNFNYPYKITTENSLGIPMVTRRPCDLLNYFNKKNKQKKVLVNENGDAAGIFGLPYLVCNGNCDDNRSTKLGVKISFFNLDDLGSYIPQDELIRTVSKSLRKRINLDVLKLKTNKITHLTPEQKYEIYGVSNNEIPQNSEIKMIYTLQELVLSKQTPHINLPVMFFQCNIKDLLKNPSKKEQKILKGDEHLSNTDLANVLVSEWCTGGSLDSYIEDHLRLFSKSSIYFDVLLFQLLSMLMTIHRTYPSFRHNDLHLGNILVEKIPPNSKFYLYQIKDITNPNKYTNYVIPNLNFQIRLWDYDLSTIDAVVNNKSMTAEWGDCPYLSQQKNQFFDLVKFFFMFERDVVEEFKLDMTRYNSLIYEDILGGLDYDLYDSESDEEPDFNFFKTPAKDNNWDNFFSNETKKMKDITGHGCLNSNIEKTTPERLLKKHSFGQGIFKQFIVEDSQLSKYNFIEKYKVD